MKTGAMAGQGRPHRSRAAPLWRASARLATAIVIATSLLASVRAAKAQDAPPGIGLRIAFGGGAARRWVGTISLSAGRFAQPQLLGLEPDEPGSMAIGEREIRIQQRSPRSYDGLDLSVLAPLDASLKVQLATLEAPTKTSAFTFRLQDLITGMHPADGENPGQLDAVGNRLVISRRPGDELRIELDRDSLVFTPGETFTFRVVPHLTGIAPKTALRMRLAIVSRLTGEEHFLREQDVEVAADGTLPPPAAQAFALPPGDDVYEIDVTYTRRTFLDPLVGVNPLVTTKPVLLRRLQFIAVASAAATPVAAPRLELIDEFDPVLNDWSERVTRLPLLKHLPRMNKGRLSHGEVSLRDELGQRWVQLAADAWQAHPLSIAQPGSPHLLEVEYPSGVPQTLGVSVLETNAVGVVAPLGVDSAVQVQPLAAGEKPAIARQRLIFWPRTKTPVLLLTSLQANSPAVYGRVRLYRSTTALAPRLDRPTADERLVAAWLDKPLFAEVFSAAEARDLATTRSLDDWRTFYEGSTRLVEYLAHVGYNAVVIPALCEGSTIYPSRLLEPTPKYDTGLYLTAGEDPQRKDVLELLLRICDREGMTLMPSLQFDAPLPELEVLLRGGQRELAGLELVDHDGRSWLARHGAKGGLAPYYNPLDERVQIAMARVVSELAERYGHHPSFGGVVLQLSPRGYAMLPHAGWGLDDKTFASFAAAHGSNDAPSEAGRFAERARYITGAGRQSWLEWRSAQMTALYGKLAAAVESAKPGASLVLAGHDMLDSQPLQQLLHPTLQTKANADRLLRDALREIGLDPPALAQHTSIVLVSPQPFVPSTAAEALSDCDESMAEQLQAQLPGRGVLLYREPVTRRLASFDAVSPFGRENTYTWLAAQVAPSGAASRRPWVQCIASGRPMMIFDGGWMPARGQEGELTDLLATLRSLPTTLPSAAPTGDAAQPIVMQRFSARTNTTACVMNQTAWPVVVKLLVTASPQVSVTPVGPELSAPPLSNNRGEISWLLELPPYGIAAGVFDEADVKLELATVQWPVDLAPRLEANLKEIRQRAAALKIVKPLAALANAGFEDAASRDGEIAHWLFARGDGLEVTQAAGGHRESTRALQVTSRGPEAWVRSEPLAAPRTGRIAVWVRLRTPNPSRQPELRLAIEARRGRQTYYRYATVGAGSSAPLGDRWAPFVLQIDDLPRQGLDDFRIGFDLMGAGEVWIDDVEIYDTSFTDKEQFEISRRIAAADHHLRSGNVATAASLLDGYWPRFLLQHIEPSPIVELESPIALPSPPSAADAPPAPPASNRETKRNWLRWMPSLF